MHKICFNEELYKVVSLTNYCAYKSSCSVSEYSVFIDIIF